MAAATEASSSRPGTEMYIGRWRSIITTNETNVLKTTDGKVASVIIANVGTTATLDIYDTAAADTANKIFEWVTADGKGTFALQCPMAFGIRVVTGGTFGRAVVVWS
jgi:hypothetical protein